MTKETQLPIGFLDYMIKTTSNKRELDRELRTIRRKQRLMAKYNSKTHQKYSKRSIEERLVYGCG